MLNADPTVDLFRETVEIEGIGDIELLFHYKDAVAARRTGHPDDWTAAKRAVFEVVDAHVVESPSEMSLDISALESQVRCQLENIESLLSKVTALEQVLDLKEEEIATLKKLVADDLPF